MDKPPEWVINVIRTYGTPDFRFSSSDEFLGVYNSFVDSRRCRVNLLWVGTVFDVTYLCHQGHPNAKVDPAAITYVKKFRPGKWVDKLEEMVNKIEKQRVDDKFAPVKDGWMFRGR